MNVLIKKYPVLLNRNYVKLLLAGFMHRFGNNIRLIALPLYVCGDRFYYMAIPIIIFSMVLSVFFNVYAGAIADRYNRKYIMALSLFSQCLLICFILFFNKNIYAIFLLALLMGVINSFYIPCFYSILPELVKEEELVDANALYNIFGKCAILLGPTLGGVFAFKLAIGIECFIFLISGILFMLIQYVPLRSNDRAKPKVSLREKVKDVKNIFTSNVQLQTIVGMDLIFLFVLAIMRFALSTYMSDVVSKKFYDFGVSLMIVGGIVGGILILWLSKRWTNLELYVPSFFFSGLIYIVFVLSTNYVKLLELLFFLQGIFVAIIAILYLISVQTFIDNARFGKFFGVMGGIEVIFQFVVGLIFVILMESKSPIVLISLASGIMILAAVWGALRCLWDPKKIIAKVKDIFETM